MKHKRNSGVHLIIPTHSALFAVNSFVFVLGRVYSNFESLLDSAPALLVDVIVATFIVKYVTISLRMIL